LELLDETRRGLYRILAEDSDAGDETSETDAPTGEDAPSGPTVEDAPSGD
jgi:hypothetical protein